MTSSVSSPIRQATRVIPTKRIALLQRLLVDVVSKLYSSSKAAKAKPGTAVRSDANAIIDGLIAFCRLGQLAPVVLSEGERVPSGGERISLDEERIPLERERVPAEEERIPAERASLERQVALLASAHQLLADKGLCCSGEGGGPFLKMAIQQLSSLDAKISTFASGRKSTGLRDGVDILEKEDDGDLANAGAKRKLAVAESPRAKRLRPGSARRHEDSPSSDVEIDGPDAPEVAHDSHGLTRKRLERSASQRQIGVTDGHDRVNESKPEVKEEVVERFRRETGLAAELNQAFFCLYGLNLQDEGGQPKLEAHENTSRGDFSTQEQCAEVMRHIVPYAETCSVSSLLLRFQKYDLILDHTLVLTLRPFDMFAVYFIGVLRKIASLCCCMLSSRL
jgi:hypothetical protein